MMLRPALCLLASLPLAACAPQPDPANPALWQVACPQDRRAYLFGTVHALERPAQWRGKAVDRAFADADLLMVEIIPLRDAKAQAEPFARLSRSGGHGPLSARVAPDLRPRLLALIDKTGLSDEDFDQIETWAAALMIAQAETTHLNRAYGIDKAVLAAAGDKRVEALEGTEPQLRIFDALPETEQRDLLAAIVMDASAHPDDAADLARQALFTGRNQRWAARILAVMEQGRRPFIAVGAAHMAGPDGVPALLEARGCKVSRTQ